MRNTLRQRRFYLCLLYTSFAADQTNRDILGWEMPASWFQSFNPFFVVILAYIMPGVWAFLNKRNMEPSSPTKQAIGLLLLSLGYLFILSLIHI